MLSNALDINLEATFNATDDAFNGTRYDRKWDSYANVMLGLTYHSRTSTAIAASATQR